MDVLEYKRKYFYKLYQQHENIELDSVVVCDLNFYAGNGCKNGAIV